MGRVRMNLNERGMLVFFQNEPPHPVPLGAKIPNPDDPLNRKDENLNYPTRPVPFKYLENIEGL